MAMRKPAIAISPKRGGGNHGLTGGGIVKFLRNFTKPPTIAEKTRGRTTTVTFEAPISLLREPVLPEWVDYNGHMNVAYFVLVFDHGTDVFYPLIGLGEPYRERTGKSTFAAESHITYSAEANLGDELIVTTQLLGYDAKRVHYFQVMSHAEKGYPMATLEQLSLHVDLTKRKVEPMPEECLKLLAEMEEAHAVLPRPPQVGSVMTIGSKKPA